MLRIDLCALCLRASRVLALKRVLYRLKHYRASEAKFNINL